MIQPTKARHLKASVSLHPDHEAVVRIIASEDQVPFAGPIQRLIEQEAERRWGSDWRRVVRARITGDAEQEASAA